MRMYVWVFNVPACVCIQVSATVCVPVFFLYFKREGRRLLLPLPSSQGNQSTCRKSEPGREGRRGQQINTFVEKGVGSGKIDELGERDGRGSEKEQKEREAEFQRVKC